MNLRPALIAIALAIATRSAPARRGTRYVTDPDAPRRLPDTGPGDRALGRPVRVHRHPLQHQPLRGASRQLGRSSSPRTCARARKSACRRASAWTWTSLDIRRAGSYEPWHGPDLDDTRIIRDIYPPRITLTFRRTDADGNVLDEGERKL